MIKLIGNCSRYEANQLNIFATLKKTAIFIDGYLEENMTLAITTFKRKKSYLSLISEEIKFHCKQYYSGSKPVL